MSKFPITIFDGLEIGTFEQDSVRKTDRYENTTYPRWYGSILERKNLRTNFICWRTLDLSTLQYAILQRLNSLLTQDESARRPATLQETEFRSMLRGTERGDINQQTMGVLPIDINGNTQLISAINELSIITTIDRYAVNAPPEVKLLAGVEYGVWLTRQPGNANRSNALVRSGAASLLDPYKHRGI